MQYQLFNIVNIPISKKNKILKRFTIVICSLFEILTLISIIYSFIQGDRNFKVLLDLITIPVFLYIIVLEIENNHDDITPLFLTFDDEKVNFFYPAITRKGNRFDIYYNQISKIDYFEEFGILEINYITSKGEHKEVLYFQQNEKENFYKIFNHYIDIEKYKSPKDEHAPVETATF